MPRRRVEIVTGHRGRTEAMPAQRLANLVVDRVEYIDRGPEMRLGARQVAPLERRRRLPLLDRRLFG